MCHHPRTFHVHDAILHEGVCDQHHPFHSATHTTFRRHVRLVTQSFRRTRVTVSTTTESAKVARHQRHGKPLRSPVLWKARPALLHSPRAPRMLVACGSTSTGGFDFDEDSDVQTDTASLGSPPLVPGRSASSSASLACTGATLSRCPRSCRRKMVS